MWVDQPEFTGTRRFVKRVVDILVSGAALVVVSPLMLVIALAVRLTSRGPAIYSSKRLGKGSEEIVVHKFRTMVRDAERIRGQLLELNECADSILFKMRRDPRVTRVGRVLRQFSLDELPQLVNVLTGSMSLVGPRPPLPEEVERYHGDVRRRLLVKPGLTGLWQVSGRSDLSWDESVRLDLYYVENWSLGFDFAIIARTASAVLRRRGAY
jgi:exopolysaccharide biosynthesis polyprenyl glycosylphosphotransferase